MATKETTEAITMRPTYLLPKFSSERWQDGIYDVASQHKSSSMSIREGDLLTFEQRVEVETRSLIFQYQLKYAEKEYELLKKEFQDIEAKLSQSVTSDAEPGEDIFVKPDPVEKSKKPKKNRTESQSGSETDGKATSAGESDDQKAGKSTKRGRPKKTKSGSENDDGASAGESDDQKSGKGRGRKTRTATKDTSGSEELTSSLEGAAEPVRRSTRKRQ